MEPHALTTFTPKLIEGYGVPQVLDVEHSIQVHKPTLTGSDSPAIYYLRPPSGMSVDALIEWFEAVPGFRDFRLTLVPILGLDTFHQPLISTDDFAKKYFHDNQARIIRVTGSSNQAREAITAFVNALKRPFDAKVFPQHGDFSVSGYKTSERGGAAEVKLLFKPADHGLLMKVERLVSVHLDECNLGREVSVSRHATRSQPPELMLMSTVDSQVGVAFLDSLAKSLPRATPEEVADATHRAQSSSAHSVADKTQPHARFVQPKTPTPVLTLDEIRKKAIATLADVMKASHFASGAEVKVVQAGTTIEVSFPRTISSLWLTTSFREGPHIKEVVNSVIALRIDPVLREGWSALYNYDKQTGKLHIRAMEAGSEPPIGWKQVPG